MNPQDNEQLRHALLEALNLRAGVALTASGLRRRVELELAFKVAEADVEAALQFLLDRQLIAFDFDPLGSTKWYRITAAGTLAVERG
jgi:hypothetical protein